MKALQNIVNIHSWPINLSVLAVGFVAFGLISGFYWMGFSDSWVVNPLMRHQACDDNLSVEIKVHSESLLRVRQGKQLRNTDEYYP